MKLPLRLETNRSGADISGYDGIVDANDVEIIGSFDCLCYSEKNIKEILHKINNFDKNAINFAKYLIENKWLKNATRTDLGCWYNRKLQLLDHTLEDIYKLYSKNG